MRIRSPELREVEQQIDAATLGVGETEQPAAAKPRALRFARLVVGVDGSPEGAAALEWAALCARVFGSQIHLVTVVGPPAFASGLGGHAIPASTTLTTWNRFIAEEREAAESVLAEARAGLARRGVSATTESTAGTPAKRIVAIADERGADLVILGSRSPGLVERFFLGSVVDGVKEHSTASVLIAKGPPRPSQRILAATDGSSSSRGAAHTAVRLGQALNSRTSVLHVVPALRGQEEAARSAYEEAAAQFRPKGKDAASGTVDVEIAFGDAVSVILAEADEGSCGLVVMGSRGLGGVRGTFSGSVSNPVAHRAPCSVLLYKPGAR